MSRTVCFIGEPGSENGSILSAMRDAKIEPRRFMEGMDAVSALREDPPLAIVIEKSVLMKKTLITNLRTCESLVRTPAIVRVASAGQDDVETALRSGATDVMVDGATAQFAALAALLNDADPWGSVRAPQGVAAVLEQDREERIRIAHVLKRNGFDVVYSGSVEDLPEVTASHRPRVAVLSAAMASTLFSSFGSGHTDRLDGEIPLVILGGNESIRARVRVLQEVLPPVHVVDDAADTEGVAFAINELLAPAPPDARGSKRLLSGVTVCFSIRGSIESFCGFTYNINLGGLFIRTLTPMPHGSRITVRFTPPFGRGEVEAMAQVVWVNKLVGKAGSPPGMGVQFIGWAPPDKAAYEVGYELLLAQQEDRQPTLPPSTIAAAGGVQTTPPPKWWNPQLNA